MNPDAEKTRSLWTEIPFPRAGKLRSNLKTDVLVIGAGISGLSIAYELAQDGHDVVVVDRGPIGGGMTARTSAHLSYEIDDFYYAVIALHGEDKANAYFESQKAAVDRVEQISEAEKIACDFARVPLFVFAPDRKGRAELEKEFEALPKIGFTGVDWADAPVAGETHGALRFPNQARFHPMRYVAGLAAALKRSGVKIYADTPVVSVKERERSVSAKTESGFNITAKFAVTATNTPFVGSPSFHTKQAPYRSYVIVARAPMGAFPDALAWDTEDPYHYIRPYGRAGEDFLIIGGADHKAGEKNDGAERIAELEYWARMRFPGLGRVEYSWSGQIFEPVDYLPFIGRNPGFKKVFTVSGDSGEGLTTGVAASLIIPQLIRGKRPSWAAAYRPERKIVQPSSIATYAKELLGAAKHLVEHILPAEAKPEEIARNEGAVITVKGKKVAAYRDARGILHSHSAACTHMGCIVQWNSFETCWDCPCHGSHFSADGKVLAGPATTPLEAVKVKAAKK